MKKFLTLVQLIASCLTTTAGFATAVESSCQIHGQESYNYSASLERQVSFRYDQRGENNENHQLGILVNNCKKAANRFLMVGFGPNEYSLDSSTYSTVFSDDLDALQCQIIDSTIPLQTEEERNQIFKQKRNFLNKCIEVTVAHNSSQLLAYREDQPGCKVTKVSPQRATFVGGHCFFKIFADSEFVIAHKIIDECLKSDFLKLNSISPGEYSAATTFAITDRPTGVSTDMELLPSKLTHFTLEAYRKQLSLSDDFGRNIPLYPDTYIMPTVEFGSIKIRNLRDGGILKYPLLTDNRCSQKCVSDICTSNCNFSQPLVGEVMLSEMKNGKKELIKSWYDGAVALPNWQGFLNMPAQFIDGEIFATGKRYNIEITFRDPQADFSMYNKGTTPLFMPLPGIPTMDFAANMLNGLPSVSSALPITEIEATDALPDYGVIRDFGKFSGVQGMDAIQTLSKHHFWPPYYQKICKQGRCVQPDSSAYSTMNIYFTLGETNEEGDFNLEKIAVQKTSKIEEHYKKLVPALPQIKCKWDELE